MSPRPKLRGFVALSVAVGQAIAACTLTSDSFRPEVVGDPLQPPPQSMGRPSHPMPPPKDRSEEPEVSCSSGRELAGCIVAIIPADGGCAREEDCESRHGEDGSCPPATCGGGRSNPGEAAPDCGGPSAARCQVGEACTEGADCLTLVCGEGGTCSAPSCDDGVRNQEETGVDCGGACADCAVGESCEAGEDCESGVCGPAGCAAGVERCCQAPRCDDGVRNGDEPVADCGTAACGACPEGSPCSENAQCSSGRCQAGSCQLAPCADGVRNGSETDTDCGGNDPACAGCAVGAGCAADADCASGSCIGGACADCDDGRRNGTETAMDCGGGCGPCAPGLACSANADCQSGACQDGRCCGGNLVDCTRCARRLARVIACDTNGPAGIANCEAFLDCLADHPDLCPVRLAPGCSEDPGGVCNHSAFGGNGGPGVGLADAILGTAGCSF